jgi:hypothetical protein
LPEKVFRPKRNPKNYAPCGFREVFESQINTLNPRLAGKAGGFQIVSCSKRQYGVANAAPTLCATYSVALTCTQSFVMTGFNSRWVHWVLKEFTHGVDIKSGINLLDMVRHRGRCNLQGGSNFCCGLPGVNRCCAR